MALSIQLALFTGMMLATTRSEACKATFPANVHTNSLASDAARIGPAVISIEAWDKDDMGTIFA